MFPVLGVKDQRWCHALQPGDFLVNNGGQGTTVAISSAGQAVSDCQQGYHVGGGTVALVVPEAEQGDHHSLVIAF